MTKEETNEAWQERNAERQMTDEERLGDYNRMNGIPVKMIVDVEGVKYGVSFEHMLNGRNLVQTAFELTDRGWIKNKSSQTAASNPQPKSSRLGNSMPQIINTLEENIKGKVRGQDVYHSGVVYKGKPYSVEFYVDVPLNAGATDNFAGNKIRQIRIEPTDTQVTSESQNSLAQAYGSIRNITLEVLRGKVNLARQKMGSYFRRRMLEAVLTMKSRVWKQSAAEKATKRTDGGIIS